MHTTDTANIDTAANGQRMQMQNLSRISKENVFFFQKNSELGNQVFPNWEIILSCWKNGLLVFLDLLNLL